MPFTPFHWGPGLFIGLLLFPLLDLPCFLIASVIVDIEPLLLLLQGAATDQLHAFFHTHLGATLAGLALTPFVYLLRAFLARLLGLFGLKQRTSLPKITVTALLGTNLHVLFDAFLYEEMHPFFPFLGNPLYGAVPGVYLLCVAGFFAAIPLYVFHVWRIQKRKHEPSPNI